MKKRKIMMTLAMVLCLVLALSACGSDESVDIDDDEDFDIEESVISEGDGSFEGWWVMPEEAQEDGFAMFTTMQIFPDEGIWYFYDQFGNASDEMSCESEDGEIILDTPYDSIIYELDGDQLIWGETGEVQFVRSEEPQFLETPEYDGKWYKNGDPEALTYYDIEGSTYIEYMSYDGEEYMESEPAEWEAGNTQCFLATDDYVENVPTLKLGFMMPTFYIDETGLIGYTEDMFDYIFYAHESMLGSPEADHAQKKCEIMSNYYNTEADEEGNYLMLRFLPYGFDIITYGAEGSPVDTEAFNGTWSGTWDLADDGTITLHYFDDSEEQTMLQDGTIEAVGSVFLAG